MVYDSECSKSVTLNINGKLRTLMLRKFTCTTRIFCTFFFVVVILFFFPMIYFILRVLWHSVLIKRIWFRVFILVFSFLCHWRIQILQIEYILISIFSVSSHNHDLYNLYFVYSCYMFRENKEWMWALWGGEWCVLAMSLS